MGRRRGDPRGTGNDNEMASSARFSEPEELNVKVLWNRARLLYLLG